MHVWLFTMSFETHIDRLAVDRAVDSFLIQ